MIGTFKEQNESAYQPPEAVRELTKKNQQDYQVGWDIQHRSYREFNNMSVLERMNLDNDSFNIYTPPKSDDPDKSWRSDAVTPLTRNKIISIAAHVMMSMMYPNISARNEEGDPDRDAAEVIRKMMLYNMDEADYDMSLLFGVVQSLCNPAAYLSVEYLESVQKIRKELENDDVSIEEATDEILGGIQFNNIPVDEIMIANIYQREHQKQRFIIRKQLIDYSEAEALFGDEENFAYVELGVKRIFDEKTGKFYDVEDQDNPTLIEKATFYYRQDDMEITYLNGVYLGEEDVEANAMTHRTVKNHPRYPHAKFGYEPIHERFYYYKSAADKLHGEQKKIDRMYRFIEDGTYLDVIKPIFTSGGAVVNSSVLFPGAVTDFPKDTQITPFSVGSNLNAAYKFVENQEQKASESTQDDIRGGTASKGIDTAYEASRVEYNAIVKEFGIFGRLVANAVEKIGELLVDDIIWHQTLGDIEDVAGVGMSMKFKSYLLKDQIEGGKKYDDKITFTDEFMGKPMTDDEVLGESYKLLRQGGVKKDMSELKTRIYKVNPYKLRKLSYALDVEPDQMLPKSAQSEEARKLKFYSMMIVDPSADQQAVARDFLFEVAAKGQSDKYMKKMDQIGMMQQQMAAQQGAKPAAPPADQFLPAGNQPKALNSLSPM